MAAEEGTLFFCAVARDGQKLYFLPVRPNAKVLRAGSDEAREAAQAAMEERERGEPAFADFMRRHASVWSEQVLPKPKVPVGNVREGVYAVFEGGVAYPRWP